MPYKRLTNNGARTIAFTFDGQVIQAQEGDTIASALLLAGVKHFRTNSDGEQRGPYCLMGACFECLVEVNSQNIQSCITPVADGMLVHRTGSTASGFTTSAPPQPPNLKPGSTDD